MKVTIIHGQNHKGSTYHIANIIAEKVAEKNEIQQFFLPKDFSGFCCGCTQCFEKGEKLCPHYEKLRFITEAVDNADVIILASPVYVYHCTGSMKAWLDHYGWRWLVHRPEEKMFSKQAVVVSTAAGAGMRSTNKDMKDSLFFWGVPKIYSLGTAVMALSWNEVKPSVKAKVERKASHIADRIKSRGIKSGVSFKGRILFTAMSIVNRKGGMSSADSQYWKAKGWTDKKRPWKIVT
ncbi:MAG: NAD(P)H-dependent oxidoreductase [Ruminococcus flavefaciens]|nr:NAD(P)H-dependent oxidoreductase [Ruminococcus flavefaciens]MCM1230566.1 NAD(P)H-dependent oxidoreductase [Ruminococcus flavefaciens]